MALVFPWGHMIPSLEDVSRIMRLRVYGRPVSGFTYPCYHDMAERLLELPVERRSSLVPRKALQESLGLHVVARQTGDDADEYLEQLVRGSWSELASEPGPQADLDLRRFLILFLGRLLFATKGDAVHCRFLPLVKDLSEVGGYAWGAAFLAHQFDSLGASERQTSTSGFYPFLQEDDEGQPQLVQARPYFGRSVWLHALNLVLPLNLFLCQRSLGLRQSAVEFPTRDPFRRPGRSFRGLHDTTDWRVDVVGEIASLRALLCSATQDREVAQKQVEELRRELDRVRSAAAGGASSSRGEESHQRELTDQLAAAVLRAEEAERDLADRIK
ncbi:hypothetical protein Taro_033748 [Colocasia esculenta]|uniref:Aminotransferase-like plant mobile domain-containing protein n=1 Tax=Colocasia esculenta TaxID=4460 RepID=A0A843W5L4_COLES|nr:hypothetical protein [Colocasia esculenta]